jgi:D-alanyl-D-alanine carboxypeptidase
MKIKILLLPYLLIPFLTFGQVNYYKKKIDKLLVQPSQTPFNGIILITRNGKTQYQKLVGYSDLENKTPLKSNDQFVIGSISKQITGVLVMQAYERGEINLTVPISRYLPTLSQSWKDSVNIHQLLTHTHGIQKRDAPLKFKAGTQYEYSQVGFGLLAEILESVTKKTFAELSQELFIRCSMNNSFHPDIKEYKNLVKGYDTGDDGLVLATETFQNYVAAGSFISTAEDLAKWSQSLHNHRLFKRSTYKIMMSKKKGAIRQHPIFGETAYGYGTTIDTKHNIRQIGQTGYAPGFVSMYFYYPATKTALIILENTIFEKNGLKEAFTYHLGIQKIVRIQVQREIQALGIITIR